MRNLLHHLHRYLGQIPAVGLRISSVLNMSLALRTMRTVSTLPFYFHRLMIQGFAGYQLVRYLYFDQIL